MFNLSCYLQEFLIYSKNVKKGSLLSLKEDRNRYNYQREEVDVLFEQDQ